MAAAHVDVGAACLAGEHEIQMVVLEVLRVGKLHHFARCVSGRSVYEWLPQPPQSPTIPSNP